MPGCIDLGTPPKILRLGSNFWEGTDSVEHATGIFFVNPLPAYQWGSKEPPTDWIKGALYNYIRILQPRHRGITTRGGKSIRREIFRSGKAAFLREYFVYFKGKRRVPGGKDPSKAAAGPRGIAPKNKGVLLGQR